MFYSPYETYVGRLINSKELPHAIKTASTQSQTLMKMDDRNQVISIYSTDIVSKFDHPVLVPYGNPGRETFFAAVNLEPFIRLQPTGDFTVSNTSIYTLQMVRAAYTADLRNNGTRAIKSLQKETVRTYADLLTNVISVLSAPNVEDLVVIKICSAWLYHSMLSTEQYVGDLEAQTLHKRIADELGLSIILVSRYLDNKVYQGIEEYLSDLKEKIQNPTIQQITPALFFTSIAKNLNASVWLGVEKQQMMSIAVEHIPTFIGLLTMCLSEQPFRNSGLYKIADRYFRTEKSKFLGAVQAVVTGY